MTPPYLKKNKIKVNLYDKNPILIEKFNGFLLIKVFPDPDEIFFYKLRST